MAKVDLKAKAKECLDFNKLENVVIVIDDGTCFLKKAESHAINYANSNGLKKVEFTREDLLLDAQAKKAEEEAKEKEKAEKKAKKAKEDTDAKLKEAKQVEEHNDSKAKEQSKAEDVKPVKKATTAKKSNTKKSTK